MSNKRDRFRSREARTPTGLVWMIFATAVLGVVRFFVTEHTEFNWALLAVWVVLLICATVALLSRRARPGAG